MCVCVCVCVYSFYLNKLFILLKEIIILRARFAPQPKKWMDNGLMSPK